MNEIVKVATRALGILILIGALGFGSGMDHASASGSCAPGDAGTACGWDPDCDGTCIPGDCDIGSICRSISTKPCVWCINPE